MMTISSDTTQLNELYGRETRPRRLAFTLTALTLLGMLILAAAPKAEAQATFDYTTPVLSLPVDGNSATVVIDLSAQGAVIGQSVFITDILGFGDLNGGSGGDEHFTLSFNQGGYTTPALSTGFQCTGGLSPAGNTIATVTVEDIGGGTAGLEVVGTSSAAVDDLDGCPSVDYQFRIFASGDSDNDGVPDTEDDFPNDPNESNDADGDGVGDNGDAFPDDPDETQDSDSDGFGDNGDVFPANAAEWRDEDNDGIGDNADADDNGDGRGDTQFADVTVSSGISYSGETWGASWGDFDGDDWPDLFVSNHRLRAGLYRNNRNGTFTDIMKDVDVDQTITSTNSFTDTHGATWADYDNDGDQDLMVASGIGVVGAPGWRFYVNENGVLNDRSTLLDGTISAIDVGGGRFPAWLDINNDGLVDVLVTNQNTSVGAMLSTGSGFTTIAGPDCGSQHHYVTLSDLNDNNTTDVVCGGKNAFPQGIFEPAWTDVRGGFPDTQLSQDSVIADFDGDLRPDVFQVRGGKRLSGVSQAGPNAVEAQIIVNNSDIKTLKFRSDGVLTATVTGEYMDTDDVYIGASGYHPSGETFTLDPADTANHGSRFGGTRNINIGYNPITQMWNFSVSSGGTWTLTRHLVQSTTPITSVFIEGQQALDLPIKPSVIYNTSGGYIEDISAANVNEKMLCVSVAAGDFDNDMDIDVYAVCRGGASNLRNRLYENDGSGRFTLISNNGSEGQVGSAVLEGAGTGESVVVADYDNDGFLDLFTTNGLNETENRDGGTHRIFHNQGNSNNWIELDLVGTSSNIDAIGARVYATVNGVMQLREQNGGYHRWSQNFNRIHFGLGNSDTVDLEVRWPSGNVDNLTVSDVNRVYRVTENDSIVAIDFNGPPVGGGGPPGTEEPLDQWAVSTGGVAINDATVSYSGAPNGWNNNTANSVVLSTAGYDDDYQVNFTVSSSPAATTWVVGLGIDENQSNWRDVDYAFRSSNGNLFVYESGNYVTAPGVTLSTSDVLSIYVHGGTLEYRLNGTTVHTTTYAGTPLFYVDSSFQSGAITLTASITGEAGAVTPPPAATPITNWIGALGGVSNSGADVSYSGAPTGWSNNTINSATLSSLGVAGDFRVSFTVNSDSGGTVWVVGLGDVETSSDWRDVDFGFRSSNGALTIYENGSWATGGLGQLVAGDELSLQMIGGTLEYLVNGIAVYSRPVTGSENFYIDSSFKAGAIDLRSFEVTGF